MAEAEAGDEARRPLLLDTHAILWWFAGSSWMSATARAAIENPRAPKFVSAASAWEIATKLRLERLPDVARLDLAVDLERAVAGAGFQPLPISIADAEAAARLPEPAPDPFDRMLIAQAMLPGLALVSIEAPFDAYGVTRVW